MMPADVPFSPEPSAVLELLKECPTYSPTPLTELPELARELGVATLWAKLEAGRMGLGSFKALGGAYAVAKTISERLEAGGHDPSGLLSPQAVAAAGELTFVCASAGNHGLSVAAGARVFGARSVIFVAETVSRSFAERLSERGAEVIRRGAVYEDAMEAARVAAQDAGAILVSDSSWPGYLDVPATIMEGYTVMAEEMRRAFDADGRWPTHVALQAGVGGMAAAVAANVRQTWSTQPEIIVVEPDRAPCLMKSVEAGALTRADGPVSNMGRLDCKDASLIAFQTLKDTADRFVTVSDEAAQEAATLLETHGAPTTPSGAAGLAGLMQCALPADARALVIVSEGPVAD